MHERLLRTEKNNRNETSISDYLSSRFSPINVKAKTLLDVGENKSLKTPFDFFVFCSLLSNPG